MSDKIIRNSVICLSCKEEIESKHVHDFKWCKCKTIAVDGGKYYLKRTGDLDKYMETSVVEYDEDES